MKSLSDYSRLKDLYEYGLSDPEACAIGVVLERDGGEPFVWFPEQTRKALSTKVNYGSFDDLVDSDVFCDASGIFFYSPLLGEPTSWTLGEIKSLGERLFGEGDYEVTALGRAQNVIFSEMYDSYLPDRGNFNLATQIERKDFIEKELAQLSGKCVRPPTLHSGARQYQNHLQQ